MKSLENSNLDIYQKIWLYEIVNKEIITFKRFVPKI